MKNTLLAAGLLAMVSCTAPKTSEGEVQTPQDDILRWEAVLFYEDKNELGEGAIWNHETNELWSVDIEGKKWFQLDVSNKSQLVHQLDQRIGTIVPSADGRAVVALEDGVYYYDPTTGEQELIVTPDMHTGKIRFNDGKCDPSGRLWVGSMHLDQISDAANLYKISADGGSEQMLDSVTISNGIVWSSDQKTMYYIDTPDGKVRVFDYDDETGTISNERSLMDFTAYGYPDGSTIDAENNLWVCLWNGNKVLQIDTESGEIIGEVHIPAHNITSCAFGGENLDSLFITSARVDMSEAELDSLPHAGSIFVAVPGVKGVKANFFGQK
ncbi:SMP-30/gluconolactonase/LRE family protein [Reichenbachiella agariperforans]|uniref:SMP-30/gluconolactonase/LRE family protein n=1 Tax=Reichenbachiella agariperforans TaxID=156994 RepID=UPI001C09F95D|nr:SMP-30/gluconolactonase/LRE family protein [Reichenbachiella agariperforans]MBU2912972.1 SMP-30/gluconolactonase/LRE family protein [Reichenbachiella agariperforans]